MFVFEGLPQLLHQAGVRHVFGLTGSSNVAWIGAGVRGALFDFHRVRHEGTAVSAAAGFARATGRPGVASVTLGPGFANAVNALTAVVHQHVPVLLVVGESPSGAHFGLQDVPQRVIAESIGAGYHVVQTPASLADTFQGAWQAMSHNGNPQVLSIPDDLLGLETQIPIDWRVRPVARAAPDPEAVAASVDVLERSKRPVLVAGQGAVLAGCKHDMIVLAKQCGAALATTLNVNHLFAGEPNNLGVCGHSTPAPGLEWLYEADAVVAVGASMNAFTTGDGAVFPRATVVQCEIDDEQRFVASAPELGLLADARHAVRALSAEWSRRGLAERPVPQLSVSEDGVREQILSVDLGHNPARGLDPRHVLARLDAILPADRTVVADGGRCSALLPALLRAQDGHSWISSRGHGSIGLGLGAALGAAVARSDRRTVLFCGDAGFMMAANELDSVRLNEVGLLVAILDDGQHGSELRFLDQAGLGHDVARQDTPDLVMLARAFGGDGVVVSSRGELDGLKIPEAGLFLAHFKVDPGVDSRAL